MAFRQEAYGEHLAVVEGLGPASILCLDDGMIGSARLLGMGMVQV